MAQLGPHYLFQDFLYSLDDGFKNNVHICTALHNHNQFLSSSVL